MSLETADEFTKFAPSSLPSGVSLQGHFSEGCVFSFSQPALESIRAGRLTVRLSQLPRVTTVVDALECSVAAKAGTILLGIARGGSKITIGAVDGSYNLVVWRPSKIQICSGTTSNGTRILADLSEISIGTDCMFSDDVLLQGSDQHGILDVKTREIINNTPRRLVIGDHVWLARRCTVMPDATVGPGCIIGAGSLVSRDIPSNCIAVGVPASIVKRDVTWSRHPDRIDSETARYLELVNADGLPTKK